MLSHDGSQILRYGISDHVGDARGRRLAPSGSENLDENGFHSLGPKHGGGEQADGAGTANDCDLSFVGVGVLDGMHRHFQRRDHGTLVQRDVTDGVHPSFLHGDGIAQSAATTRWADEAHLFAKVVLALEACGTGAIDHEWFDHHVIASRNVLNSLSDHLDDARQFVAQDDWKHVAR